MRNVLLTSLLASLPGVGLACGGFFCSSAPVDQQAERIIFVQESEGTVTSYVEIQYQGEADDFAWVVPVPEAPELDTWHGLAFNALDLVTQPQFRWNGGCFDAAAEGDADGGGRENAPPPGAVDVLQQERVGPFDTVVVQSEDPRALVEWLRVNGYRILPAMEPFIALYTAEGMAFLAMKLAPGEGTEAIEPIKMTYRAAGPAVPLRLTAVAAQLEMGVKVWVLSDGRTGPINVPEVTISDDELVMDPWTWTTNYQALVARSVDEAGGRGFVTELATPTRELAQQVRDSFVPDRVGQEGIDARDALADLLDSKPYVTRMYTRLSPEEMAIDPMFGPVAGGDVSNVHQVPDPEPGQDQCGGPAEDFDACAFAACGAAGECAVVQDERMGAVAGCACPEGTVARAAADGSSRTGAQVGCGDVRLDFAGGPDDDPNLAYPDPCVEGACGPNGSCTTLNGFAACRCDTGFVAVARRGDDGMPQLGCESPAEPLPPEVFVRPVPEPDLPYPGRPASPVDPDTPDPQDPARPQGTMSAMGGSGGDSSGCSATPGASDLPWALFLTLPALIRRRR